MANKQKNNQPAAAKAVKRDAPATLLSDICTDPRNPRRRAITLETDAGLQELADSISKFGDVLEPLIIRQRTKEELREAGSKDKQPYMLISGHRRMAAAKLVGIEALHCILWENISPAESFEMQLVENLYRVDLFPTEEAFAYQRMSDEFGYTHKEISLRVGKSEKHILRYLKLNSLPDYFKEDLDSGETTIQKALFLLSLPKKTMMNILDENRYWLSQNYKFDDFQNAVQRTYIEDLTDNLPFKLDGKYGDLPKCTECPHKGSHSAELFAEYIKKDKCPYAFCFRDKAEMAAKQKANVKTKTVKRKIDAEEEEYGDDNDSKTQTSDSSDNFWKKHKAIQNAKRSWYLEKLMAKRVFIPTDIFTIVNIVDYIYLDEDFAEFILQYIGKSIDELKQSGTPEELIKAKIIDSVCIASNGYEDEIIKWLGCERCPDKVLQKARSEAIGIKK